MGKITQEIEISQAQARRLALKSQGLLGQKFYKGKKGVDQVINQIGYIQIDTISVAQRAHHHTIWTRIPDYQNTYIWDLLSKDKKVFEHWSHAAAFLPMEAFRYSLWKKHQVRAMEKHWHTKDFKMRQYVLDRIGAEGPLQSKDFEHVTGPKPNWYTWKPAKIALEQLFMEGYLMVSARKGFQKIFDLTERVLPSHIDTSLPSAPEMAEYLIRSTLKAHGFASIAEMNYLRRGIKKSIQKKIEELLDKNEIISLNIKGINTDRYFAINQKDIHKTLRIVRKSLHFLNPFDNSIIQRKRVKTLFDFDYLIEVYVPQAKRKYGYYSLPILWGDQMVGRVDVKADRKSKTFLLQHLWKEESFDWKDEEFLDAFQKKMVEMLRFNECDSLKIVHCNDQNWWNHLKSSSISL